MSDKVDWSDLSDAARVRLAISDAAMKRASWRYIKYGLPVPEKLQYRAAAEFDRPRVARRGEGSLCSGGVKRRREEAELEEELDCYVPDAFGETFGRADWVHEGAEEEKVVALLCKRTTREEAELKERRRRDENLNELLLEQGISADCAAREKSEEWRCVAEEQAKLFVDLGSDDE